LSQLFSKVTVASCSFYIKMFNVCALLLKPATKLINGAINETLRQTLDISQGSVSTHLRCCGNFSDSIITHILLILAVT